MKIKELFKKDISTPIEGVIKADDLSNLLHEVKEYVFTEEVCQNLSRAFLPEYLNYENANGVWISGFFGSGKSHLLKMLSLLLENRELDGIMVADVFKDKLHDEILKADVIKAVQIPSESILFNIFQKHDGVITSEKNDPVLSIFLKVFNEHQGYYGTQPRIAHLERDLDHDGLYDAFKEAFTRISGRDWNKRRQRANMARGEIIKALAEVKGDSEAMAERIYDDYRDFSLSIDRFAKMVRDYLDSKPSGFRLNFFADEVGKFCEGNTQRMFSLQTISETLATVCKGRAFLFVTSQEDIQAVVGEFTRAQAYDFSKIQDRFRNRINLTSRNVDEVIHRRLLEKSDNGAERLHPLYEREKNNFRTLFDFSGGGHQYKHFDDESHFVNIYPFVPYHFQLFEQAIKQLSRHGAFQGQHQSVGERSMLSVFQEVVKKLSSKSIGSIASFDQLYDGLQPTLISQIQSSIISAERNLDNPLLIRVLKALFMVKYVKEFEPSLKHITTLLIDHYDVNLPDLEKDVLEALSTLAYQNYIQAHGGRYEFLTDKEKDIIKEIKAVDISEEKVSLKLGEIVFDRILRNRKIAHQETGREFSFTQYCDLQTRGREQSSGLGIRIVSPLHPNYETTETLAAHAMDKDELLMLLPDQGDCLTDIRYFLQTEDYIRTTTSHNMPEEERAILETEQRKNMQRWEELKNDVGGLINKATFLLNGKEQSVSASQPENRINQAFQKLIEQAYFQLSMLPVQKTEQDVLEVLRMQEIEGMLSEALSVSETEIFNMIQLMRRNNTPFTVKDLLFGQAHSRGFTGKPYGWNEISILYVVARLFKKGKIDILENNTPLDAEELASRLTKSQAYANLQLRPIKDVPIEQIKGFKVLYKEFLLKAPDSNDAKTLGQQFKEGLKDEIIQLNELLRDKNRYPFLSALEPGLERIKEISKWSWNDLFDRYRDVEDELLDFREELYDPIRQFRQSAQIKIFDDLTAFVQAESSNLKYVDQQQLQQLVEWQNSPTIYRGNAIREAKSLLDSCKAQLKQVIADHRGKAIEQVEQFRSRMLEDRDFQASKEAVQEEVAEQFDERIQVLEKEHMIDSFGAWVQDTQERLLPQILKKIKSKADSENTDDVQEYIPISQVRPKISKLTLSSDNDIDEYTDQLNKDLKILLRNNKNITLN